MPTENRADFRYVGANPATPQCPRGISPRIHPSVYLAPFSFVVGDVEIAEGVFLAPHVSVRADEGTPFYIGAHTNLQDGVILHGLTGKQIERGGKRYSIYIGAHVSCGHGCVVHGPCLIEDGTFIGFGALVHSAGVGAGCHIGHHAVVTGVRVASGRRVPVGAVVDSQEKADALPAVSQGDVAFAAGVQEINNAFPAAYAAQAETAW